MIGLKIVVVHLIFFIVVTEIGGLKKVSLGEDNGILHAEHVIRTTTNKLFSTLKIKMWKLKQKLKDYIDTHAFFVSLTIRDHVTLQHIVNISKVDKETINNRTSNFIDLINEILNVDSNSKSAEQNENTTVVVSVINDLVNYVDDGLQKLIRYQNVYAGGLHEDINILKTLKNPENQKLLAKLKHKWKQYNSNKSQTYNNKTEVVTKADSHRKAFNETEVNKTIPNNLLDNEYWVPEDSSGRRIYEGKNTKVRKYPFVVSIHMIEQFQCAGTIIDSDLVLTAASCLQLAYNNRFFRENPAGLSVRVGSNYFNGGGEVIPIMEIFFYPTYDPNTLRDNLAIVRMIRRLRFTGKTKIKKIEVDRRDNKMPMNVDGIFMVGWGARTLKNVIGSPKTNILAFAQLELYPFEECQQYYNRHGHEYVTDQHFCTGFLSKGSGACHRDVGDPAVSNGVLIGIVSFGSKDCGTPNVPTVFTKIGYYFNWIEEVMEKDVMILRVRTTEHPETYQTLVTPPPNRQSFTIKMPPVSPRSIILREPFKSKDEPYISEEESFQDFLRTMFNSHELSNFINVLDDQNDVKVTDLMPVQPMVQQTVPRLKLIQRNVQQPNILHQSRVKQDRSPNAITNFMNPTGILGFVQDLANRNYSFTSEEDEYKQNYDTGTQNLFDVPNTMLDIDIPTTDSYTKMTNSPSDSELEKDVISLLGNEEFQDIIKGSIVEAVREVQTDKYDKTMPMHTKYQGHTYMFGADKLKKHSNILNENDAWEPDLFDESNYGDILKPDKAVPSEFTDDMFRSVISKVENPRRPNNFQMTKNTVGQDERDPKVLISQKLLLNIISQFVGMNGDNNY